MAEIIKVHQLDALAAAIAAIDDGETRKILADQVKEALFTQANKKGVARTAVYDVGENKRLPFDWPRWFVACRTSF